MMFRAHRKTFPNVRELQAYDEIFDLTKINGGKIKNVFQVRLVLYIMVMQFI